MLQCQEVVGIDGYKEINNINSRFGQYYDYMELEQLSSLLKDHQYHLLILEHPDERFINVVLTTEFYRNQNRLFDIGEKNWIFVYPKQYLSINIDSYMEQGSKLHLYFSKRKKSYCVEKLVFGSFKTNSANMVEQRSYYTDMKQIGQEIKQKERAKILTLKNKKEEL